MSDRTMFEYIANTYLIGNHDTPGIMATHGPNLYYKNYQKFTGTQSMYEIGDDMLEGIENGNK